MISGMVSIIIPVFNAEEYVEQVLQDVMNQTYRNLEVIVINDGSTDSSWDIIQNFARNDTRFNAIQVQHSGPSKTRNIGLRESRGEFIRFLDADDRVPENSIQVMIECMQKNKDTDLVIGNYQCTPEYNYFKGDTFTDSVLTAKEFAECFVKGIKSFYYGVTWNKLYRKEILEKNNLLFDEKIDWCEDLCFNLEYYKKCHKIHLISIYKGIYTYCPRINSITNSLAVRTKEELRQIDEICYEKVMAYFALFGLNRIAEIEWKYSNLYYQLSAVVKKDKYKKFRQLLSQKDIQEYIHYKKRDSGLWMFLDFVNSKKMYILAYFLFYVKNVFVARFERIVPTIKDCMQNFLPKSL